ncbi:MAG: hypothetical protein WEG56_05020 [Chloroflexota bacterium]
MSRSTRVLIAGVVVLIGGTLGLFFGGQVGMCLGPLNVTAVQCARATGIVPDVGLGRPILALTLAIATLVAPVPVGRRLPVLLGGIIGGMVGAASFLALRPLTMEGFDSTGTWIAVPRPLDVYALATAVIIGAFLGGMFVRLVTTRVILSRLPR